MLAKVATWIKLFGRSVNQGHGGKKKEPMSAKVARFKCVDQPRSGSDIWKKVANNNQSTGTGLDINAEIEFLSHTVGTREAYSKQV